jgi:hypothetical protein
MGFFDGLKDFTGEAVGKFGAMAQEVQALKLEYGHMSNTALEAEFRALKGKSDKDSRNRLFAITGVLQDRGLR